MSDIDIVEILRQKARGEKNSVGDFWGDLYLTKAAAEIESLRAQNKRLMSRGIEDMKHEIKSLRAERDRLREALEVCVASLEESAAAGSTMFIGWGASVPDIKDRANKAEWIARAALHREETCDETD